jgi:HEXXH motif-containing protein
MRAVRTLEPQSFAARALNFTSLPWAPGLAGDLAHAFWSDRPRGLTPVSYGTVRWRCGSGLAPRDTVATIDKPGRRSWNVERLTGTEASRLAAIGLTTRGDPLSRSEVALFHCARELAEHGSGLAEALDALVHAVHLLEPQGPGYDTSHSDPELPCSVFVSVPFDQPYAAIRLAESLVHEAMHLQLTMLERHERLVRDASAKAWSPWQHTMRPALGLLHGLFVFRTIDVWLDRVQHSAHENEVRRYAGRRRRKIAREIVAVTDLPRSASLTRFGTLLARRLLELGN